MRTIEEKAKRYDEIIEKANKMHSENCEACQMCIEELIPELKESEDEKIIQFLIHEVKETSDEIMSYRGMNKEAVLAWLEKQAKHANFRNKIQIGDKVTRNEDGVLVNLSQLNRVVKKQGEQKSTNNQFTPEQASVLDKHIDKFLEQKPAWSEEDIATISRVISIVKWAAYSDHSHPILNDEGATELIDWLKSIRPQSKWSPSDEQMKALWNSIPENVMEISEREMLLDSLYQDLKKLL